MAYPRARRRSSASIDSELVPPRPSFLTHANGNRSSSSSLDSLDPASDSDRESPPQPQTQPSRLGLSALSRGQYQEVSPTLTPMSSTIGRNKAKPPPPSSFAFPFQAHAGNPDPGLPIPGGRRRSSLDSAGVGAPPPPPVPAKQSSSVDGHLTPSYGDLRKPFPPFMADPEGTGTGSSSENSLPRSPSGTSLYRQSAAGTLSSDPFATPTGTHAPIPRNSSTHSFRAPFLAPSSRPTSSIWAPPSYSNPQYASVPAHMSGGGGAPGTAGGGASPNESTAALPVTPSSAHMLLKAKPPPLPSTRLTEKLANEDKPWLSQRAQQRGARSSYAITLVCILVGLLGAAAIVLFGWNEVHLIDEKHLCSVLDEQFSGGGLDEDVWNYEVQLGGFGNGEFQMTTKDSDNVAVMNNQLYITPTLTSLKVDNVLDGGSFDFGTDCTTDNSTACSVSSDAAKGVVINPVMSGRIHTKGKKSMRYGKVEVRAKLPRGDWLWPAIWMLPEREDVYGIWPASGELDIVESRGNDPATYAFQGNDFVRATLNYGPMAGVYNMLFGWWQKRRGVKGDGGWGGGWHTWTVEWDERVLRVYVDKRSQRMLEVDLGPKDLWGKGKKKTMWELGGFPRIARNGSAEVVVENPYKPRTLEDGTTAGTAMAPFDQKFYVLIDLAVGGTSGWFPDGVGGKMWYDGSLTAMRDFAKAQDEDANVQDGGDGRGWYKSWPEGRDDRSLRVDYIKMWEKC
ncbi:concanavalin A-like lectin/glucanase domain-containing protein [Crepidotus variabilis]|uniref:Concanavalin A-like lectin/glucanase domain-containing protein n=1 Tax=Crepidotus variabilis TaxID=179855 RepID=A0A9P6E9J9_9AGAR|nr:concanavalin A-like lectin/glucanase domain-containing protein [Crepidotus variabilis]